MFGFEGKKLLSVSAPLLVRPVLNGPYSTHLLGNSDSQRLKLYENRIFTLSHVLLQPGFVASSQETSIYQKFNSLD